MILDVRVGRPSETDKERGDGGRWREMPML